MIGRSAGISTGSLETGYTIDLSGQFRAPLFNSTLMTLMIAGVLLAPLEFRFATKTRKHET